MPVSARATTRVSRTSGVAKKRQEQDQAQDQEKREERRENREEIREKREEIWSRKVRSAGGMVKKISGRKQAACEERRGKEEER